MYKLQSDSRFKKMRADLQTYCYVFAMLGKAQTEEFDHRTA